MEIAADKPVTDWVSIELLNTKKLFMKLPFDPFVANDSGQDFNWPTGLIKIPWEVYVLLKMYDADGGIRAGLATLRSAPGENIDPPYYIRVDHICMISKLSPESQIYKSLNQHESGLVTPPKSTLYVP